MRVKRTMKPAMSDKQIKQANTHAVDLHYLHIRKEKQTDMWHVWYAAILLDEPMDEQCASQYAMPCS